MPPTLLCPWPTPGPSRMSNRQTYGEIVVIFPELTSLGKFPEHISSSQRLSHKIPEQHWSSCHCKRSSPSPQDTERRDGCERGSSARPGRQCQCRLWRGPVFPLNRILGDNGRAGEGAGSSSPGVEITGSRARQGGGDIRHYHSSWTYFG